MKRAQEIGADRVELFTGPYAAAYAEGDPAAKTRALADTARAASALGMGINAGHDLNLDNLQHLVANVPELSEVSIGHALIADALAYGLSETIGRYLAALEPPIGTFGSARPMT